MIRCLDSQFALKLHCVSDLSKDPIARKMRLRRGRRDQEEADQDQAKILKVSLYVFLRYQPYLFICVCKMSALSFYICSQDMMKEKSTKCIFKVNNIQVSRLQI
jgi:hypothetical protein